MRQSSNMFIYPWYEPICVYVFVKRTSPGLEAENNSGELHGYYSSLLCLRQQAKDIIFQDGIV